MSIDAMKQALEALRHDASNEQKNAAAKNLVSAIEAAEKQEPVAWLDLVKVKNGMAYATTVKITSKQTPLYATPQPAIPEGWQLVPVEMSDETNIALGDKYGYPPYGWKATYRRILAMLAAAPKPENSHE